MRRLLLERGLVGLPGLIQFIFPLEQTPKIHACRQKTGILLQSHVELGPGLGRLFLTQVSGAGQIVRQRAVGVLFGEGFCLFQGQIKILLAQMHQGQHEFGLEDIFTQVDGRLQFLDRL